MSVLKKIGFVILCIVISTIIMTLIPLIIGGAAHLIVEIGGIGALIAVIAVVFIICMNAFGGSGYESSEDRASRERRELKEEVSKLNDSIDEWNSRFR